MGKEPLLDGDTVLGYVTSANFGYTVGKSIVYAYVPTAYAVEGTHVSIYSFGENYPATVSHDPLYDAGMKRLKQ